MAGSNERIKEILAQAMQQPPAEREAFVQSACNGDATLLSEVRSFVQAMEGAAADGFFAAPSLTLEPDHESTPSEGPGTVIGPYKILQAIGEGGFGSVYMADQERPVRRRVALKIIKLGMDTRQVIARFEAERQALAMMDHPNIARVLDAGATELGRPYFVMELVRGDPITEYCDRHNLGMRERLELFVQVCQAVQHAHQKGVIHRDLKPSNVLVTVADGKPIPKVIDFGIAKATASRLTDKTLFTEFRQLIGTPEYMSPEQAEMSGVDIDTRSDIYSLGVLLYELLTGLTPFDGRMLRSAAFGEMQRIIREVEPEKPSTRLSRLGDTLASVAAHRQTEPANLRKQISGDLDSIVMKCLEKDRTRRYETANGLVRDVGRYLRDEPVEATPPSLSYRMRKFVRRHRGPATAVAMITLALLVGLALSVLGLVLATAARDRAQTAQKAEEVARKEADAERQRASDKAEQLREELYITQIRAAQRILESGGNEPVKPLLALCDSDLRGWEWDRLNWLADRSDRTLQCSQPTGSMGSGFISYSADGRRFFTVGDDDSMRIWDADTMRLLHEYKDPEGALVIAAAYSPDGTLIAVGTSTGLVRVINAASSQVLHTFKADNHFLRSVAIDPENTRVAAGTWDGSTIVWNLMSGERESSYGSDIGLDRGEAVQFSADGSQLLIGSLGNNVGLIDLRSGQARFVERGAGFVVMDAALSPDDGRIASVGQDARLWMRDARTGRLIFSVATGGTRMSALAFHPSGDFVAGAGDDGVIAFFDSWNGEKLGTLFGHEHPLLDLCFDPDGRWLLSLDNRGMVKRWHMGVREPPAVFNDSNPLRSATFSPDGSTIYVGALQRGIILLDAASFEPSSRTQQPLPFAAVGQIFVSPDGQSVAATGIPVGTQSWCLVLCDQNGAIRNPDLGPSGAAFSSDSQRLATAADEHTLTVCDVRTGMPSKTFTIPDTSITSVNWGEGDKALIVGCADGTVRLLDTTSGEITRRIEAHEGPIMHAILTAQRDTLVTACIQTGSIKVWEWPSGTLRFELTDTAGPISIAVSPDGRRLIAGGNSNIIPLWDLRSGRRITTVGTDRGAIRSVAFSPDGRSIIACGESHAVRIWETTSPSTAGLDGRYLRDAERRKNRRELLELDRDISSTQDTQAPAPSGVTRGDARSGPKRSGRDSNTRPAA